MAYRWLASTYKRITRTEYPWRSAVLVALIFSLFMAGIENQAVWGMLVLVFAIPMLITGVAHMAEEVSRDEYPVLYWLVVSVWLIAGLSPVVAYLI